MTFIKKNWKKILFTLTALLCILAVYLYWQKVTTPEIIPVTSTKPEVIKEYFPMESESTVKDISRHIETAKTSQAPQYHYYTVTQQEADKKAERYAKEQKADKVIKETKETEIKNDKGETSKVIENDYYAINLERKHKIKVGAAIIERDAYAILSYQNRDVEYKAFYAPEAQNIGVGIEYTIAKW